MLTGKRHPSRPLRCPAVILSCFTGEGLEGIRCDSMTCSSTRCAIYSFINGSRTALPRWLDEGVCQWASDGISELMADPRPSRLNQAVSAGAILPLRQLETAFPSGDDDLLLAYEASKGFVVYLVNRFGKSSLIQLLRLAAEGHPVREGLLRVTAETLNGLERDWHASLKGGGAWFVKVSHYLYEVLFVVMALLAAWGFIRQFQKKRAYRDDGPEDGPG